MAYISRQNQSVSPYAVGNKIYGGGRSMPNIGPVDDKLGYKERDLKHQARRNAISRRIKAKTSGKHASADALREV